jgi:hypothetical protein
VVTNEIRWSLVPFLRTGTGNAHETDESMAWLYLGRAAGRDSNYWSIGGVAAARGSSCPRSCPAISMYE